MLVLLAAHEQPPTANLCGRKALGALKSRICCAKAVCRCICTLHLAFSAFVRSGRCSNLVGATALTPAQEYAAAGCRVMCAPPGVFHVSLHQPICEPCPFVCF